MTRKFILPLALSAAAVCAFVPSAASAQWHGGGVQFSYSSGYPYGGYYGDGYDGYYDRGYYDQDRRWRGDRWDRDDWRRRHSRHERWEHRGHHYDDDD